MVHAQSPTAAATHRGVPPAMALSHCGDSGGTQDTAVGRTGKERPERALYSSVRKLQLCHQMPAAHCSDDRDLASREVAVFRRLFTRAPPDYLAALGYLHPRLLRRRPVSDYYI